MLHRIREVFAVVRPCFEGPVEVDECYIGGKRANMSHSKRQGRAGVR